MSALPYFPGMYTVNVFLSALLVGAVLSGCARREYDEEVYTSERLLVERIDQHVYRHVSYLAIPDWGTFPCNGLVYMNQGVAVVIDTPVDEEASEELIAWIRGQNADIRAVIPTHFHVDCLGGLETFHRHGVPSYANTLTVESARSHGHPVPQNGFNGKLDFTEGLRVVVEHFGAGHTSDNVVVWLPEERVLFGGCLVKEIGAGKGNLADADTLAWSETVRRVIENYPDASIVVPGHGDPGGVELLEYTVRMFETGG